MITKYNLYREQNNLYNESLKDKLKGKSDDDILNELGLDTDYISVKIMVPSNYPLPTKKYNLKEDRKENNLYTTVSGKVIDVYNFISNWMGIDSNGVSKYIKLYRKN